MEQTARVLSNAIVQLPERKYPGCVVQGDTMNSWIDIIQNALDRVDDNSHDAFNDLKCMLDNLKKTQENYEAICRKEGIAVPYVRRTMSTTDLEGAAK